MNDNQLLQKNVYIYLLFALKDKTVRVWNIENADNIPMVQEKRKNIGKILKSVLCYAKNPHTIIKKKQA